MVTGEAVTPCADQPVAGDTYPTRPLVNAYGPTEAADDICQGVLDQPLPLRPQRGADRPAAAQSDALRARPQPAAGSRRRAGRDLRLGHRRRRRLLAQRGADARELRRRIPTPATGAATFSIAPATLAAGWRTARSNASSASITRSSCAASASNWARSKACSAATRPSARRRCHGRGPWRGRQPACGLCGAEYRSRRKSARSLSDLRREQIALWQDLHEDSYRDELLLRRSHLQRHRLGQQLHRPAAAGSRHARVRRLHRRAHPLAASPATCWRSAAAPA